MVDPAESHARRDEATGTYWKSVWHMLEEDFTLVVGNAGHIRNLGLTTQCRHGLLSTQTRADERSKWTTLTIEFKRTAPSNHYGAGTAADAVFGHDLANLRQS